MKSSINYTGQVTVKINNKAPQRRKNKGSVDLFKAVCEVLTMKLTRKDGTILTDVMPGWMSIVRVDKDTLADTNIVDYCFTKSLLELEGAGATVLLTPLAITKRDVKETSSDETGCSAIFTALLNHSQINIDRYNPGDEYECAVMLISGNLGRILAATKFDLEWLQEVRDDENGQASITWEMIFSNKPINTEETA